MANRTSKEAKTIHGTNPQFLIEKIIRTRIHESLYWKEKCFAVNEELLVDRGVDLQYVGGIYGGNIKPTPFLCLILKMLQIQPEKDIVHHFIVQDDFKYCRALGAFYLRLTGTPLEIYQYLEPLLNDFRKLRRMDRAAHFTVTTMDVFVDDLLREDRMFDVILPRLTKRQVLEESGELEPRISALDDDLKLSGDDLDDSEGESTPRSNRHRNRRSRSLSSGGSRSRDGSEDGEIKSSRRDRERERDRRRRKSYSRSPDRYPRSSRRRSPSPYSSSRSHRRHYDDEEVDRYRDHRAAPSRRRSRSTSRDRRDRRGERRRSRSDSRDRHRDRRDERSRRDEDKDRKSKKDKKDKKKNPPADLPPQEQDRSKPKTFEEEIAEQNRIRASLGLKPLRV